MDEVLTAADASASLSSAAPSPSASLSTNLPLVSAFLACAIAQFLKLFTTWFKEKRWDSRRLLGSGGMPSSHSATVTALAMAIGLQQGTGASSFALAVVLASIVMYDASGIRLHAGRQAELLNQIVCELPPEHPLSNVRPLREPLGHTPLQDHKPEGHACRGAEASLIDHLCEQRRARAERAMDEAARRTRRSVHAMMKPCVDGADQAKDKPKRSVRPRCEQRLACENGAPRCEQKQSRMHAWTVQIKQVQAEQKKRTAVMKILRLIKGEEERRRPPGSLGLSWPSFPFVMPLCEDD